MTYDWCPDCFFCERKYGSEKEGMKEAMLKIERSSKGKVVITLMGRIETEDVAELQRLLTFETVDHHLVLELKDVTLVDGEVVKFLARCEADRVQLENCPAYSREWVTRERGVSGD